MIYIYIPIFIHICSIKNNNNYIILDIYYLHWYVNKIRNTERKKMTIFKIINNFVVSFVIIEIERWFNYTEWRGILLRDRRSCMAWFVVGKMLTEVCTTSCVNNILRLIRSFRQRRVNTRDVSVNNVLTIAQSSTI